MEVNWTLVYYLSEWLIRVVMLVYVPQRRSPAAARTWLLLIFFFPWVGLLLYALVGRIYMPRKRVEMQARVSELIKAAGAEFFNRAHLTRPQLEPRFMQAVTLAENLGDFRILGGNHVELLADYAGAIDRLIADIDAARHHVHLLYYIFADDDTGRRVVDALVRAVKRGVQCRVLMDGLGSRKAFRRLSPRLKAAGIEAYRMLPASLLRWGTARYDLRNHRKIAVIDGRVGYVGSQNLVNPDFKKDITYEELVARVTGPVVLQLQAVFISDWLFETGMGLSDLEHFPDPEVTGNSPAQTLPSGPGFQSENTQRLMVSLIYGARERVVITTPYFIPDEPFLEALQTAVRRGVDVHLVLSRQADQLLVSLAQKSYYEELLEAGVRIHLYYKRFLHAKHLSIDAAVALIGSSNIDIRSFALNAEISLLIYDPRVVAELRTIQERYFDHSELLTLEKWSRRSLVAQVAQNTARLVNSVL
jgi:cardiolipin synthase